MRKKYDGLEVVKICFSANDIIATSVCVAMIQLKMENGICVSPEYQQQVEYVGDQG